MQNLNCYNINITKNCDAPDDIIINIWCLDPSVSF